MPKPELEFFRPDSIPWEPVAASPTVGVGGAGVRPKMRKCGSSKTRFFLPTSF